MEAIINEHITGWPRVRRLKCLFQVVSLVMTGRDE
jgi:hypothetical protein